MATSPRTPEAKAARRFADSIDSMSFDPYFFAMAFSLMEDNLQIRFAEIINAMIETWRTQETATHLPGTPLAVLMGEANDRL